MTTIDKEVTQFDLEKLPPMTEAEPTPETAETVSLLAQETGEEVDHQLQSIAAEPGKIDAEIKSVGLTPEEITQIKAETGIDLTLQEISDEAQETAKRFLAAKEAILRNETSVIDDGTESNNNEKISVSDAIQQEAKEYQEKEFQPKNRAEVMKQAIIEFLKGDFEKSKEHRDYIKLQENLAKEGAIARDYYPGSLAMLQEIKLSLDTFRKSENLEDGYSDSDVIKRLDEKQSQAKKDRDRMSSLEMIKYMKNYRSQKDKAEIIKRAREEVAQKLKEKNDLEQSNYESQLEQFPEQKKNIEGWEKLIDFYEGIQEKEETEYNKVEEILSKAAESELTQDELGFLEKWQGEHSSFGLEEMPDLEYFALMKNDPRLYAHTTAFFGKKYADYPRSNRFVAVLKDGSISSVAKLKERGDVEVSADNVPQDYVTFDGPDNMAKFMYGPKLTKDYSVVDKNLHFGYGASQTMNPEESPPVTLLAPAQLLEEQSNDIAYEDYLNSSLGVAEKINDRRNDKNGNKFLDGVPFGSANKDPNDPAHEINLSMFVAVIPNMEVDGSIAEDIINDLMKDERSSEQIDSMLLKMKENFPDNKEKKISLKDFMLQFTEIMKNNGLRMPRLFFFDPVEDFNVRYKDGPQGQKLLASQSVEQSEWIMRNGVQSFLGENGIVLKGNPPKKYFHQDHPIELVDEAEKEARKKYAEDHFSKNTIGLKYEPTEIPVAAEGETINMIPELFKFPTYKLEEAANKVRRILKQQNAASQPTS